MEKYRNLGGNSNVSFYEIGTDYIDVQFYGSGVYRYSYKSAGREKVEQMKLCARQGIGLNSYIKRNANKDYERR